MTLQVANSAIMPQPPTQFATLTDVISYEGDFNRAVQSELATILRAINANIYTPGGNLATLDALASVANLTTLANQSAAAKVWTDVNDGAGSGLDADTLDGHDTGYFQQALGYTPVNKAGDTMTGVFTFAGDVGFNGNVYFNNSTTDSQDIIWKDTTNNTQVNVDFYSEKLRFYGAYRGGGANIICYMDPQTGKLLLTGDPTTALGAATKQYVDNNYAPLASNFSFTGAVTFEGNSTSFAGPGSGNVSIELGGHGYSNAAFIDFHSGATDVDYDSRIIASGGDGTAGHGTLTLAASHVLWGTAPTSPSDLVNKSYVDSVATTPDYGAGNAALAQGAVGTYALAQKITAGSVSRGGTLAAANLRYVTFSTIASTSTLSGTWRLMSHDIGGGSASFTASACGLWLRIA